MTVHWKRGSTGTEFGISQFSQTFIVSVGQTQHSASLLWVVPGYRIAMQDVSISAAIMTWHQLKWYNGLQRKNSQKCIPWVLDVISAAAPGELFRANACNYTVTTVRAIRLWRVWICAGITGRCDELILGTAAHSCSPPSPSLLLCLSFSSVSSFSLASGRPLWAFKRLLEVHVRHGLSPAAATHTVHPACPKAL